MNNNIIFFSKDDHTCRIWDVETQQEISRLLLKSAGISVSWHNKLPNQVFL
jgi:WD40 repeat protein